MFDAIKKTVAALTEDIKQWEEWIKEIEDGIVRHSEARGNEPMVDVTDTTLARYKRDIERFKTLIAAYEAKLSQG